MGSIHPIDVSIIVGYLLVVMAVGFHFARRTAGAEDYFLAGRRLGWLAIGFSLFASNISSSTLIGLCGTAYAAGIGVSAYEWMAAVILVFFSIYFIPYYLRSKVYTMPEFLERRFRPAVRYYFSGLTIFNNVFIDISAGIFAGVVVIRILFPEIPTYWAAFFLAALASLYTAAGGLAAVVYTDTIQAVIVLLGATVITVRAVMAVGSWEQVVAATPPEMLSIVRPIDDPNMPWLGMITGVPILGFYFWCTNQFMVQRVLGARNVRHAQWGSLFAGLLKLPVLFIMIFPGLMARQLYPGVEQSNTVYPMMINELLPVGLKGLMLAAVVAAIMSSIDSTLNSASTLVTMDFVRKFRPQAGDRTLAWSGRITALIVMAIAAAWTPVIESFSGLFEYLQEMLSYLVPPVAAIFLIGLFWKRANGTGGLAGLIVGHGLAIICLIARAMGMEIGIHFLILAAIFFVIACVATIVASLLGPPPDQETVADYTYSKRRVKETMALEAPVAWYLDYRVLSAGLLALTAWLVISYW